MVTASHNPKSDNGLKLFKSTSAQIEGPLLIKIEDRMANAIGRHEFFSTHQKSLKNAQPEMIGDELFHRYLSDIKQTKLFNTTKVKYHVPIVYTPLHGVGKKYFTRAVEEEGFDQIKLVEFQAKPDRAISLLFCIQIQKKIIP